MTSPHVPLNRCGFIPLSVKPLITITPTVNPDRLKPTAIRGAIQVPKVWVIPKIFNSFKLPLLSLLQSAVDTRQ